MALSDAVLPKLPPKVRIPDYDRSKTAIGVMHIGLGAFHRAHQLPVFDDLLALGHHRSGVLSVAVNRSDLAATLARQDGLYTLTVPDAPLRVIGAVRRTLVAAQTPARVIAAIADPAIRLVTLSITEKGYAEGGLVPDILARGLRARRAAHSGGVTILSCDNLSANGAVTQASVLRSADPGLADWAARNVSFPSAMVDRITPRVPPSLIDEVEQAIGCRDDAPIRAEAFSQWVVEDRLAEGCPPLAEAGVTLTSEIAGWERLKLRMLNGAHSTLAYVGLEAGTNTVAEAFGHPDVRALVEELWSEMEATLPSSLDTPAYRDQLRRRFADRAIVHRLTQIAEDGSVKLPQRLIEPWVERDRAGAASPAIAAAVAGWARFVAQRFAAGSAPIDPLGSRLSDALAGGAFGILAILGCDPKDHPNMIRELGGQPLPR